jgi:serine/threonine protein kinase
MTDRFPEKFGKYKIVAEVGRGGFADVYKAVDTTLNRAVALKFLEPRLLREPTFVERFQREAQLAANLKHPNVVIIHEFGWEAGTVYLAMEFLEGRTLKEVILQEGALHPRRIVNIVGQIASALDYAHGRGLVHRDIKPSNIMVEADDHVTVMDFGIAKAATQTALTTTGKIFGTPEYMSPEQAEGLEEPDARSDVYSLGVVIFEMFTGTVPFSGTTPLSVMRGHADKPPPSPSEFNPDVSPAVEAVLLRTLAKKREERYQSVGEMAVALQQAVSVAVVEEVKAPSPVVAPAVEPIILWLVGPNGQSYELKPGSLTLGRAKSCDIQVNDPQVSRQHATLEFDGQNCTVYDEGSANGTFVNGQRVGAEGLPFNLGDDLSIGTTHFSLSTTESLAAYDEVQRVREEAKAEPELQETIPEMAAMPPELERSREAESQAVEMVAPKAKTVEKANGQARPTTLPEWSGPGAPRPSTIPE